MSGLQLLKMGMLFVGDCIFFGAAEMSDVDWEIYNTPYYKRRASNSKRSFIYNLSKTLIFVDAFGFSIIKSVKMDIVAILG